MDATMSDGPGGPEWAGVEACTLTPAERPRRVAEFDELFATSLRSIDRRDDTSARMLLAGGRDLAERVQRLADAESSCCSFFTFGVTMLEPGVVGFDIAVPTAYAEVLARLVARADAAVGGGSGAA